MPLDHYVSQVHLRNFYSPALASRQMYGFRKNDLYTFPCSSGNVCRIDRGSTNKYLTEPRAIEDFLRTIEPRYNAAVEKLRKNEIDKEVIYVISGFAAYVAICSPTGMRLHIGPLKKLVEASTKILEAQSLLPPATQALGNKMLSQLLESGEVEVAVDGKYPQAIGISTIFERQAAWGNGEWDILINQEKNSPFFTSDFPVGVEPSYDPRVHNRVIPLAPDIAIRIKPNIDLDRKQLGQSFKFFSSNIRKVDLREIAKVNTIIVRCAENLVFYRDNNDWVMPFLKKNRAYKIETRTVSTPQKGGFKLWSTTEVQPTN